MAYYDKNGKITIDEVAAQEDIKKLKEVAASLDEARNSIQQIYAGSADLKGKSMVALNEVSSGLIKKYDRLIADIEDAEAKIAQTVEKYKKIDESLKNVISI